VLVFVFLENRQNLLFCRFKGGICVLDKWRLCNRESPRWSIWN